MPTSFKERVKFLQDPYWSKKDLLPYNQNQYPLVDTPDTEIIYDFESQNNIYSVAAFYKELHKLIIWYKVADDIKIDEKAVLQKTHEINDLTIKTYRKELGEEKGLLQFEVKELTFQDFRRIFERPKRYVVGFNSNYYDLPFAAYILSYGYSHNGELPDPRQMRKFSNLLISPKETLAAHQDEYQAAMQFNHIQLKKNRLSIWDLDKIFKPLPNGATRYPNGQENPNAGAAPSLYETYRRLGNTGLHLDMKLLNEKDKDASTRYTSLKRISAQLGYQIEEPEAVDLSSNDDLTPDQMITLLAYNASDVLVTTLIYGTTAYQNVLSTREGLLNRFDESNFRSRLNLNSTSAQFVEKVIAPDTKLKDQENINFFYPVHDKSFDDVQANIDKDFVNKDVPEVNFAAQQGLFQAWLEAKHANIFDKAKKEYEQAIEINRQYAADQYDQNPAAVNDLKDGLIKQNQVAYTREQRDIAQIVRKAYDDPDTRIAFLRDSNLPIDRDALDTIWTKRLQTMPLFAPREGRFDHKVHQRFRVKYGEIQEDLLERMSEFEKFPEPVYTMYSFFRGAKSEYDIQGNLVKTARDVAVENYVKHFLPIYGRKPQTPAEKRKGQPGEPIPPKDVYYKFKQKTKEVTGIGVIIQVDGRPMCLSFSVGGVHGEVMNSDAYVRDRKVTEKYNKALKLIQDTYGNDDQGAMRFVQAVDNDSLDPTIASFIDFGDKPDSTIKLFVTKHKGGTFTYKKLKKPTNPKDYVIPIDMENAVHVDVDSLYPSLMINLHLFSTWTTNYNDPKDFNETNKAGHWDDVYAKLRAERVALKKFALETPKENWGPKQKHAWEIQLINKLLLNSASGIADGKWDTNVRVNNRAASMRIMGQMALTYLVYSVEPKGVYSTSTNTDGVYLTSDDPDFTEKQIDKEIAHWRNFFHLGATPEIMSRFVSKDSNNRFEKGDPAEKGAPAGGTIGNAFGASSAKKMVQPFVIDAGIVNYFNTHENVCTTYDIPYDDIKAYLLKQQQLIVNATEYTDEVRQAMLSFCWPIQPHKHQNYAMADKESNAKHFLTMQHVNRVLLVKHGYYLRGYEIKPNNPKKESDKNLTNWCVETKQIPETSTEQAYKVKISNFDPSWQVLRVNLDMAAYFKSPIWSQLDIDAYTKFTISRILGKKGSRIWVAEKFEPLAFAAKTDKMVSDDILAA